MRKFRYSNLFIILGFFLLIIIILANNYFIQTYSNQDDYIEFDACILKIYDNSLLLYKLDTKDFCYVSLSNGKEPTKIIDLNKEVVLKDNLYAGQIIKVTTNSLVLLTYPSSYETTYEIKVSNKVDMDLYLNSINKYNETLVLK